VFGECQPFGTNSRFPVQFAKILKYKLQDLIFSCKLLQEKEKKEERQNPSRAVKE